MEIQTPLARDELDLCLHAWEKAIDEWQEAQMEAAEEEGMFKAWESATKAAIMAT